MSDQNEQQPAPTGAAYEHLVQTLTEVSQNPTAAYAANAEMYPNS